MLKRKRQKSKNTNGIDIGLKVNDLNNERDIQKCTVFNAQLSNDTSSIEHHDIPSLNTTTAFIPNIPCNKIDLNEVKLTKSTMSNDLTSSKSTIDSENNEIPHTFSWIVKIKNPNIISATPNKKVIKENTLCDYDVIDTNHSMYKTDVTTSISKKNIFNSIYIFNDTKDGSEGKSASEDKLLRQTTLPPHKQIVDNQNKYFIQKFNTLFQTLQHISQDAYTISLQLKNIFDMIFQKICQNKETFQLVTDLHSRLQDTCGDIEDLKLQNSDLIKQDQINRESLKFLTTENIRLMEQHNLHNLSIIQIRACIQQAITEIEASDLPSIKHSMQQIISIASQELEKKNAELNNTNKNLQEMTKLNTELTTKLNTQVLEIKNSFQNNITRLTDEVAMLKEENEKFVTEKSLLETKYKKAVDDMKDIKDDLYLKTEYIKDLEQTINDLQISNKYYREELIKSDTALQDLRSGKLMLNLNVEIQKIHQKYDKEIIELKSIIENLRVNNR